MKRVLVGMMVVAFCAAAFAEGQGQGADNEGGGNRNGLVAHYYKDPAHWDGNWEQGTKPQVPPSDWTFTNYHHSRVEPLINHLFIRRGWFSVRWTGSIDIPTKGAGNVKFEVWADDGCRLFIDGEKVIDSWCDVAEDTAESHRTATVNLTAGKHKIVVEYFQGESLRKDDKDPIKLYWTLRGKANKSIIPASAFSYDTEDLFPQPGRKDPEGDEFIEQVIEAIRARGGK